MPKSAQLQASKKRKLPSTSTSNKKPKTSSLSSTLCSANDLPWKTVSRKYAPGVDVEEGFLGLEEVEHVDVIYEEGIDGVGGKVVKFKVKGSKEEPIEVDGVVEDVEDVDIAEMMEEDEGGEEGEFDLAPDEDELLATGPGDFQPAAEPPTTSEIEEVHLVQQVESFDCMSDHFSFYIVICSGLAWRWTACGDVGKAYVWRTHHHIGCGLLTSEIIQGFYASSMLNIRLHVHLCLLGWSPIFMTGVCMSPVVSPGIVVALHDQTGHPVLTYRWTESRSIRYFFHSLISTQIPSLEVPADTPQTRRLSFHSLHPPSLLACPLPLRLRLRLSISISPPDSLPCTILTKIHYTNAHPSPNSPKSISRKGYHRRCRNGKFFLPTHNPHNPPSLFLIGIGIY